MPYIYPNRPHGSCVTDTESQGVGVLTFESDPGKDVAAIVEGNDSQALFHRHGNPKLGVHDEEFLSAQRHLRQ